MGNGSEVKNSIALPLAVLVDGKILLHESVLNRLSVVLTETGNNTKFTGSAQCIRGHRDRYRVLASRLRAGLSSPSAGGVACWACRPAPGRRNRTAWHRTRLGNGNCWGRWAEGASGRFCGEVDWVCACNRDRKTPRCRYQKDRTDDEIRPSPIRTASSTKFLAVRLAIDFSALHKEPKLLFHRSVQLISVHLTL